MEISATTKQKLLAELAAVKAEAAKSGDWKAYGELKRELKISGLY